MFDIGYIKHLGGVYFFGLGVVLAFCFLNAGSVKEFFIGFLVLSFTLFVLMFFVSLGLFLMVL